MVLVWQMGTVIMLTILCGWAGHYSWIGVPWLRGFAAIWWRTNLKTSAPSLRAYYPSPRASRPNNRIIIDFCPRTLLVARQDLACLFDVARCSRLEAGGRQ